MPTEGPAGGIIFYDKGESSDGWRYLEAAPADLWIVDGIPALDLTFDEYYADEYYQVFGYYRKDASSNNMYVNGKETLGNYSKAEELTGTGIGAGKKNTELLAKAMGDKTYYTMGAKKVVYAAKLCQDLVFNVFDDWFLPSKDELNLLYVNLCKNDLGDFDEAVRQVVAGLESPKTLPADAALHAAADEILANAAQRIAVLKRYLGQ